MAESQVATQETPPMSREDLETLAKNETDDNGLILGKFKSVEDLAASYKELEGKLGQKEETTELETEASTEETTEEESEFDAKELYGEGLAEVLEEVGIDVQDISKRFQETSEISEDDYSKLGEAGFSKTIIDTYLNGLRGNSEGAAAIAGQQIQSIKDSIGGDAEYTKLQSWATQNLPESDLNDFNSLLEQGNVSAIKWGVQGLYSQYKNAMGTEPDLVSGKSGQSGATPFRSSAEVQAAMKDPRYGKDVTYTENVYARMADSDVFSTKR